MDTLIDAIRDAFTPDASDDAKTAAAAACRAILSALEAKRGEPLASETSRLTAPSDRPPQIAEMVQSLKGVPGDQLLDLAIARLRAALPDDAAKVAAAPPIRFQLVQLPPVRR